MINPADTRIGRRSVVAFVLILFSAMQSHADIWNTAYYATAAEIVLNDLETLVELAGTPEFNSDRSEYSKRFIAAEFCEEDKYVAARRASTEGTDDDQREGPPIGEWHAVARGALSALANGCNESDHDCVAALGRLSIATGSQDLLSDYVTERILNVMCVWSDLITYEPELAPNYPGMLPRPYPYTLGSSLIKQGLQPLIPTSAAEVRRRGPLFHPTPAERPEFEFSPDAFVPSISERSTFAEALTDFLLIRASQEVLYYLIEKTTQTPPDELHAFEVFLPRTMFFLRTANITQIATLVPALRSAVDDDMRTLPERLIDQMIDLSSTEYDLDKLYAALEFVRNGLAPELALARLVDHEYGRTCGPLDILGIVAREWSDIVASTKTTIGGVDRVEVHQMKLPSDGSRRPYIRHLFKQDGNTVDQFLMCNFGPPFNPSEDPDYGLEDLTGEVYWYHVVASGIAKEVEWRIEKEDELADLVTGLFLRMEQIHRLVAEKNSGESNESKGEVGETASSANPGAEISEVLRVTIDAIELTVDAVGNHTAGTAFSGGGDTEALKLWLQAYHAVVDMRYTDAVSAGLRYVYVVPVTNNAKAKLVRGSIKKIEPLITLGANLLEAESSEELQAALYAATAPVGSSALKHQSGQHVTIGAYVGVAIGGERKMPDTEWDMHVGPALPLGVELTFGPPERSDNEPRAESCCPIGIFLSPVDLGVVASTRINFDQEANRDNETEEDGSEGEQESPKTEHAVVGWAQLLAPSAYAVLRLSRDLPLALAVGIQYSPRARMGETNNDPHDVIRLSLMLAVDVTLFRF